MGITDLIILLGMLGIFGLLVRGLVWPVMRKLPFEHRMAEAADEHDALAQRYDELNQPELARAERELAVELRLLSGWEPPELPAEPPAAVVGDPMNPEQAFPLRLGFSGAGREVDVTPRGLVSFMELQEQNKDLQEQNRGLSDDDHREIYEGIRAIVEGDGGSVSYHRGGECRSCRGTGIVVRPDIGRYGGYKTCIACVGETVIEKRRRQTD